jgi:hypothetical protein
VAGLLAPIEDGGASRREWLGIVPSSKAARGLAEQMEKVEFLKELGADRLVLPDLPLAGLEYFARRMMTRKPAALARIKDSHRTIEVACFLRLTLLRLMDGNLMLLDHQISALWRGARERDGGNAGDPAAPAARRSCRPRRRQYARRRRVARAA